MAKNKEKQGIFDPERLKWYRNVNVLGAVALAGAGVAFQQYQAAFNVAAATNVFGAGGAEAIRRRKVNKKRSRKTG